MSEYHKQWYKENKIRISNKMKSAYASDPEYRAKVQARNKKFKDANVEYFQKYGKKYRQENKKQLSADAINRYRTDITHYLKCILRTRMRQALVKGYKTGSAVKDLGCSIEKFKIHLEKQFKPGMTWENRGSIWHIDHIIPLFHFDLKDKKQWYIAANYKNMQPMFAEDNWRKNKNI